MLSNILEPSREVDPRYEAMVITTLDGKSHSGIIAHESEDQIRIKDASGKELDIQRNQLASMSATGKSLMPDGLEQDLDKQRMADLIAYLITTSPKSPTAALKGG